MSWDKLINFTPLNSPEDSMIATPSTDLKSARDGLGTLGSPMQTARSLGQSTASGSGLTMKSYDDVLRATKEDDNRYEVILVFDSENTCSLAFKYLQSRRYVFRYVILTVERKCNLGC
jgi:hypothetical protein